MEIIINPFSQIKNIVNKEIKPNIFPLRKLISQYQNLEKDSWKDLDLTTYFLDTVVDILELKLRYLFSLPQIPKEEEKNENIIFNEGKWRELKKYLEEREEKGIKVFWREKKQEFVLNEKDKINITEIYYLWKESKKNKPLFFNFNIKSYSLEDKMKEILDNVKNKISFFELVKNSSKLEKIYYFLALCELVNQGKVKIYQEDIFGDIIIEENLEYARL